jgi:hypothetical protein
LACKPICWLGKPVCRLNHSHISKLAWVYSERIEACSIYTCVVLSSGSTTLTIYMICTTWSFVRTVKHIEHGNYDRLQTLNSHPRAGLSIYMDRPEHGRRHCHTKLFLKLSTTHNIAPSRFELTQSSEQTSVWWLNVPFSLIFSSTDVLYPRWDNWSCWTSLLVHRLTCIGWTTANWKHKITEFSRFNCSQK